jgi:hypothetical protein
MARRTGRRRNRTDIAAKLIGIGLVLGLIPLLLGKSTLAAGFRPLAPFGWLAFAVGCGMLWWQLRQRPATVQSATVEPARAEVKPTTNRPIPDVLTQDAVVRNGQHQFGT